MTPNMGLLIVLLAIAVPLIIALAKNAYMAPMLMAANVAVFFIVKFFILDGTIDGVEAYSKMALNPVLIPRQGVIVYYGAQSFLSMGGEVQTLFTSAFVHIDSMHIFFNIIFLLFWAPVLENRIGARRLALVYVLTGIAGSLGFLLFNWNEFVFAIGASGALFGIAGCFVALYPDEEMRLLLLFIPLPKMKGYAVLAVMFLFIVALDLIGYVGNIAHEAHLAGMFAGLAIGYQFKKMGIQKKAPSLGKNLEVVTIGAMAPLADTPHLKEILEHVRNSREAEIAYAWTQEFLENAKCPKCGAGLGDNDPKTALKGKLICSSCGWISPAPSSQHPSPEGSSPPQAGPK